MKKSLLILLFCAIAVGISAQEQPKDKAFLMFLHGGYGYAPNSRGDGLTTTDAAYAKKIASGASWNAQAYFRTKMFIVGLMYSGHTSSGSYVASLPESQNKLTSSDKLLTTYIGPQLGMNIPVAESFDIGWNVGLGGMWLKNNGTVFEKPRVLKGGTVGANLNVRGVYNFTKNIGISAEVMGLAASLGSARVGYHDQNLKVEYFPLMPLYQFSFSIGLKCSF